MLKVLKQSCFFYDNLSHIRISGPNCSKDGERYPADKVYNQNLLSYPLNSAIHPLNNWGRRKHIIINLRLILLRKARESIQLFQKTLSKEKQTSHKPRLQGSMGSFKSVFIAAVKVKFATTTMTSTSTVNICLHLLKEKSKNSSHSYFLREVPLFDSVRGLKEYFLERYREELLPAADTSFRLGYFGDRNIKFSITSEIQLGEELSLVKKRQGYFVGGPTCT